MNVRLHHVSEGIEYHPVSLDRVPAGKRGRDDSDAEVSAAVSSPLVPDVQVALVVDLKHIRLELSLEPFVHPRNPLLVHGAT